MPNNIVSENNTIHRLRIENRLIKRLKLILFDHNTRMEKVLLIGQIRNLRINRDDRIGKLEQIRQGIDKTVTTNLYVSTSPCLIPTVAIATKKNSGT